MTDTPVLTVHSGSLVEICINRPKHRNSLTKEAVLQLHQAFTNSTKNPATRCVLLSGAGTEAFCAGADLSELTRSPSPSSRREFFEAIAQLIEAIQRCPVPVVGMVHGFALAGGCGLAAACDITLAADDAQFGLPEVALGLAPMVVMAPIERAIGSKRLSYLVLTGERISASQALTYGLVTEVIAKGDLNSHARKLCDTLSKNGPQALRAAKSAMLELREHSYFNFLHELADRSALISIGDEAQEGLRAFTEKRPPSWRS